MDRRDDVMAGQSQHRMSTPTPSLGQLQQLTGEGRRFLVNARSFPVRIGRGEGCQVQLAGEGIWERHVELRLNKSDGEKNTYAPSLKQMIADLEECKRNASAADSELLGSLEHYYRNSEIFRVAGEDLLAGAVS